MSSFPMLARFLLNGEQATLRGQEPIILSDNSEPEPDMVIAKNTLDDYLANHPVPSDILLLIEITDSSLKYGQEIKLNVYAEAGIADYWILNLLDNRLECYTETYQATKGKFGYRRKLVFLQNKLVSLPSFPQLFLDLSKVFPG